MTISRRTLFQFFKYAVYVLLAMNIYWFFAEEFLAAKLQFPNGVDAADWIEAYSATIDTAAWVVLLLMFELETYVLDDDQFTKPVILSLHGLRALCYAFIIYAFYGYIANLTFHYETSVLSGISNLCSLATEPWSWADTLDEYTEITGANCAAFSDASVFHQFKDMRAVADTGKLTDIRYLAWVDVVNAGVWLLVVLLLEIDVRLQEHGMYEGLALKLSNIGKFILYSLLLLAAIYWGFKGDFVDFWDAFLWLVAFVFIELNVFEWHLEEMEGKEAATLSSGVSQ